MKNKEKKLIAFDYDGVIVDSMELNRRITNEVCQRLAGTRKITQDDIENLNHMSFQEVSKVIGVPEDAIPVCLKLINKMLVESYGELSLFKGIPELIKRLSEEGKILAIVTHNTEKAVHSLLRDNGIDKCFDSIMGAETEGEKSDKLIRLQGLYNLPKKSCYMIGDSVGDIKEAKIANFKDIGVSWGFQSSERLKSFKPIAIAETPEEIYEIVSG